MADFLAFLSRFTGEGEDLGLLGVLLAEEDIKTPFVSTGVQSTIRIGLDDLDLQQKRERNNIYIYD